MEYLNARIWRQVANGCNALKKVNLLGFVRAHRADKSIVEYLQGVAVEAPIFRTAYTPVYSNEAFAILGYALEKVTGDSMEAMFNKSIIGALGLHNTYYTVPQTTSDNDIIPGPESWHNWYSELGGFNP